MRSGIKVKEISWGNNTEHGFCRIAENENRTLETLNEFHGEYDLDWVIEKRGEIEVARYNCKQIETISWKDGEIP